MNTKLFLPLSIIVMIAIVITGVYFFGRMSRSVPISEKPITSVSTPAPQAETSIDEKTLPAPIIPPIAAKIATVSDTQIVIEGPEGEMTLPKDPSLLSVFRRADNKTFAASIGDVSVGMSAEVHIIEPGKKVNLILL